MRHRYILAIGVPIVAVLLLLCPLVSIGRPQTESDLGTTGQRITGHQDNSLGVWLNEGATAALTHEAGVLLVCALGAGLFVAGIEALDAWRERRAEDVARLHSRMVMVLQRDRVLKDLAVTPSVRLPLWGRSGPHVELRGEVPTLWLRYAVRHSVEREAAAVVETYRIVDRMTINPEREMKVMAA
jgi:hypothetical protein